MATVEELNARLEKAKEVFREQKENITNLTRERDDLQETLEDRNKYIDELEKKIEKLESSKVSVAVDNTDEINELKEKLDFTVSYLDTTKDKYKDAINIIEDLNKTISDNENSINAYKSEIANLISIKETSENYATELNKLKFDYGKLEESSKKVIDDLHSQIESFQTTQDTLNAKIKAYEKTIKDYDTKIKLLESKIPQIKDTIQKEFDTAQQELGKKFSAVVTHNFNIFE